ncbi:MAG: recombinase family protein [Nitrospirae bacterium]|nr:recombinase family protein [Nitrospirota bacterium]
MIKAIGYIRVSTNEQVTDGISLDNQKAKIEGYCQLNDLELVEIISDAGLSGKNLKREGIQKLISKANDKSIGAIVVYKLDRLSRRVLDTLKLLELFDNKKVAFHSISEKIDTESAMGKFFLNVTASFAQMERDVISERTSDAMHHMIKNGKYIGEIPYGYSLSEDRKTLLIDEKGQEIKALIKKLHEQGQSFRSIAKTLTMEGYKPYGKAWYPMTVYNILNYKIPVD